MAKAGEVATFLKDIAALSTESLRLNAEELAETKEMRREAASVKEERERLAIEMRRERLLRGFTDPKKMGALAVKAPFKAIEGIRETTRWFKNSILGTTTKAFFGLMTKSISLGFAGFAGALKGIGRGMGGLLGGAFKAIATLGAPLLAGIGMLLGPMGIGLAAIGYLGYNMLKSYSGKPEEQLMAHFGINKKDIKLSHRMGFGFDQAVGGIAGLIDSFMRSMGFQSNLKEKYMGLGIGKTIQSFMSQFDTHLGFIDESIKGMFEKGGLFNIIEDMMLGTKERKGPDEFRKGGIMGRGGLFDIVKEFFKEGSYFDKIITTWTTHINPAMVKFYNDVIKPFLPEITGKEISKSISSGTATFFMGDEQTPGSIRNMLKNLGTGIKGVSEFIATLFWGSPEIVAGKQVGRSGKGLFGFMGRIGSGFSAAWEGMEFKNFNKLMSLLFGGDGKKGILQQLTAEFGEGALGADYSNVFTILFKALDNFAGILIELPYWFTVVKNKILHMVGMIGIHEYEAKSAELEAGRTKDPKLKAMYEEQAGIHSGKAVEELAGKYGTSQQMGSLKETLGLQSLDASAYLTGFGAAATVGTAIALGTNPIGWGILVAAGIGGALGFLINGLADVVNSPTLPVNDKQRALEKLIKSANELLMRPEATSDQRRDARSLIEMAKMHMRYLPILQKIRQDKNKKAGKQVIKRQEDAAVKLTALNIAQEYGKGGINKITAKQAENLKKGKLLIEAQSSSSVELNFGIPEAIEKGFALLMPFFTVQSTGRDSSPVTIVNDSSSNFSNVLTNGGNNGTRQQVAPGWYPPSIN